MTDLNKAPTDCRVANEEGIDQFKSIDESQNNSSTSFQGSRRAGYGSIEDRFERIMFWIEKHPHSTLSSGEGKILYDKILELQSKLDALTRG